MDEQDLYYHYKDTNTILSECRHCNDRLRLEPVGCYHVEKDIPFNDELYPMTFEYILCKCRTCSEVSLIEASGDFEYLTIIYPAEKRFLNLELPKIVKTSYQEAIRCEKAGTPLATVVMVGRTLEALIKEFYPEQKNIFDGLEKLKDEHIISSDMYEWANELRALRNIGAHAVDENLKMIDAEESMDFLQAIFRDNIRFTTKVHKDEEKARKE